MIYFRVLKDSKASPECVESVLRGVCRFAHLINIEVVVDLVTVLKGIISRFRDVGGSSACAIFRAIITSVEIAGGQSEVLNLDLKDFSDILYGEMLLLAANVYGIKDFLEFESNGMLDLAVKAMEVMFVKRKEICIDRVCAFLKRICSISAVLPAESTIKFLNLARSLFTVCAFA